jgi:hypothetical protein
VTTVHNFSVDVSQISIGDLLVLGEIVVQNVSANGEITIVEIVVSRPSLGSELLSSDNERVEHAKSEQKCLVLGELVGLRSFELLFVEFTEGTT